MNMETEKMSKKEFDASVGGTEILPEYLNVMRFAESRASEIKGMINALTQTNGTKLIFQQLPKHMRRRTMSHKVKRLPQKLRQAHLFQLEKSGMPVKTKRPSRKWRRKPSNLLSEYNRRKRINTWLETHIWHAKRFHMVDKWGYKIPQRSCDKTFRASYRASAKYCLLQDISYYGCIALCGDQNILIEGFKRMTNSATGLTVGARAYINSQREGTAVFYTKDAYPFGAIGKINFIWKPSANTNRVIWLWAHPAFYSQLLQNLIQVFELKKNPETDVLEIYNNFAPEIELRVLKNQFNRFRLTGPLSNAIVQNAIKPPSPSNKTFWFDEYLNLEDNRQIFFDQCNFWKMLKNINSPDELSPHIVVNLITTDPRYNFPNKRTKAIPDNNLIGAIPSVCPNVKFGEIWKFKTRKLVSENKMSTAQFLKDRINLLVPEDDVPDKACTIPVMLIQRPGVKDSSNRLGYGSGWDIILPAGWGLPMWLCLIMWGARVGGLRESESIQYEMGRYDIIPPDTKAGEAEEQYIKDKHREIFFRLPPAKRVNYSKLGICCPFNFPWKNIIEDWNPLGETVQHFYILRDRKKLNGLHEIFKSKNQKKIDLLKNIELKLTEHCLIPVRLHLIKRGRAPKFSVICLPEECDLGKKSIAPVESTHDDPNQQKRKELRKEHKIFLKRMRQKRVRAKKEGKVLPKPIQIVEKTAKKMQDLWLPEPKTSIKDSCIRKVMGFVKKGDISFISGRGQSIGYIPVGALNALLRRSQVDKVLVRNTHTKQYRFANIEIICS